MFLKDQRLEILAGLEVRIRCSAHSLLRTLLQGDEMCRGVWSSRPQHCPCSCRKLVEDGGCGMLTCPRAAHESWTQAVAVGESAAPTQGSNAPGAAWSARTGLPLLQLCREPRPPRESRPVPAGTERKRATGAPLNDGRHRRWQTEGKESARAGAEGKRRKMSFQHQRLRKPNSLPGQRKPFRLSHGKEGANFFPAAPSCSGWAARGL